MKTRCWIGCFALLALGCIAAVCLTAGPKSAAFAEIRSDGNLIAVVPLDVDREIDVGGHNTVTVKDGKIAVTQADCPDHICMKRGFCNGGRDIVCLPNRLVIHFVGAQDVDISIG